MAFPLEVRGRSIGSMFFSKPGCTDYSKEIGLITALSKQIAVMIANAQLLSSMEEKIKLEYKN